jgi:hypothetical protein
MYMSVPHTHTYTHIHTYIQTHTLALVNVGVLRLLIPYKHLIGGT